MGVYLSCFEEREVVEQLLPELKYANDVYCYVRTFCLIHKTQVMGICGEEKNTENLSSFSREGFFLH